MQESLMTLLELQKIDQALHALEQLKVNIPDQLEAMRTEQAEVEQRYSDREAQVELLEKDRRQHERDLEAVQEKITKYQSQLHSVKTNKEYDALQHEIQTQKGTISVHEDAILQIMTDTEEVGETLEAARSEMEATIKRIKKESSILKKKLASVDSDIAVKDDERERMARRIEPRVINVYNRIRRKVRGVAVVSIKKEACGGCFNIIPLQAISEVRLMTRLITCQGCGRILLTEETVPS